MPVTTKSTTMFSLAVAKNYLVIDEADTAADVLVQQIADSVSAKFEQATGRLFVTRTGLTETWSGDGRNGHFLPYMDVQALTSLTINGVAVDPNDVALDGRLGFIQLKPSAAVGAFLSGIGNCTAVFNAGWGSQDAASLPSDVIESCLEWLKAIYDEKVSGATSATSIAVGAGSMVLKSGLGFNIKSTIDNWTDRRA